MTQHEINDKQMGKAIYDDEKKAYIVEDLITGQTMLTRDEWQKLKDVIETESKRKQWFGIPRANIVWSVSLLLSMFAGIAYMTRPAELQSKIAMDAVVRQGDDNKKTLEIAIETQRDLKEHLRMQAMEYKYIMEKFGDMQKSIEKVEARR